MLSAQGTGKTIEKAIESALAELKAPREDVDIKILSEGGLFKKAKVEVSISEDAKEKYLKREKVRQQEKLVVEPEKNIEDVEKQVEKDEKEAIKQTEKDTKKTLKEVEKQVKKEVDQIVEEVNKKDYSPKKEKTVAPMVFLEGFFKTLGKTVELSTVEDDKFITYCVNGEDLGDVIGRHGDAYYALTKLFLAVIGKQEKRVLLDIAGYREKREESLTALAKRSASKVAKSGRYLKLEPMKASERRIIHSALQDDDRVTTLSKGTEPHRYVIIFPKEYNEK